MTALLIAALLAAPLSDEEVREKAQAYLGAIHGIKAEQWKELGPRAAEVLEPIVTDPAALPSKRALALDGLAAAAPDRAAALAVKLARDEKQPLVVRVAAVHAAGKLKPVLQGRHAGLRGEAAEVLSRHGACSEVREQAAREKRDRSSAWERALSRCSE